MAKARKPLLALVLLLATASPAAAETITLTEDGFDPPHVIVEGGETVHFESEAGGKWSVVADDGLFDSGELPPAGGFSVAPSVPGAHVYRTAHGAAHEARLTVRTRTLPGSPGDPATPRIPDIPFPPVEAGDVDVHPSFGVEASTTRIMLGFRQDATVGEVNAALDGANVRIIGGLPETGMLLVESPGSTGEGGWSRFASLDSALASLRTSPGVTYAAMSTVQETSAVPRRADDTTAGTGSGWDWDDPFEKGNWGLARRAADRAIEVQRRRSCSSTEVVARVKPAKDGRFRVTLAAPAGERAAVYRLRAKVRRSAASPRLFDTFTLPRAVDF